MGHERIYDEHYKKQYQELWNLLHQAYMNRHFLEWTFDYVKKVRELRNDTTFYTAAHNLFTHLQHLAIRDLYLTIWKMYCDNANPKTITLRKLNNYINRKIQKHSSMDLPVELRPAEKTIDKIRKQFVAHTDSQPEDLIVDFEEVFAVLDEIRKMLNCLYVPELHPGVYIFSDSVVDNIKSTVNYGLRQMLYYDDGKPVVMKGKIDM